MSASNHPTALGQPSAGAAPSQSLAASGLEGAGTQSWDSVETYFECITTCSLDDGECVTHCVEELREHH